MRAGGSLGQQGSAWQVLLSHHLIQEQPGAQGHTVLYQAPPWWGAALGVPSGKKPEICSVPNSLLPALKLCIASVDSAVLWKKPSAHLHYFLHQEFFLVLLWLSSLQYREATISPEDCDAGDHQMLLILLVSPPGGCWCPSFLPSMGPSQGLLWRTEICHWHCELCWIVKSAQLNFMGLINKSWY